VDECPAMCKICQELMRSFTPCRNGCCLVCHAAYCEQGDVLNLENARARYREDMQATISPSDDPPL
jgi:hypothetical protein